ncbi:MAG: IS5/IS1182 family transposase, partial [SAR324 cluster bacterium]|nr:IS5/IS1182 family transposase [SAR324 cluster bacterium]
EATISHLKQHYRMGKCYLKGELGDQINVTLAAAAYNQRQWIRLRLDSFFILFFKVLKNCISHHLASFNVFLRWAYSF